MAFSFGDPLELPSWTNSRVCKIQWHGKVLKVTTHEGEAWVQPDGKSWWSIDRQAWYTTISYDWLFFHLLD
jgi:hypothetical protein